MSPVVIRLLESSTHHSHGLRLHHGAGRDGGEVRHVGQHVHHRHDGHGDDDGQRQVPGGGNITAYFFPQSHMTPL